MSPAVYTIYDMPPLIAWAGEDHNGEGNGVITNNELKAVSKAVFAAGSDEVYIAYKEWLALMGQRKTGNETLQIETATAQNESIGDSILRWFESIPVRKLELPPLQLSSEGNINHARLQAYKKTAEKLGRFEIGGDDDFKNFAGLLEDNITSVNLVKTMLESFWANLKKLGDDWDTNEWLPMGGKIEALAQEYRHLVNKMRDHPPEFQVNGEQAFRQLVFCHHVIKIIAESEDINWRTKREYLTVLAKESGGRDDNFSRIVNDMVRNAVDSSNSPAEAYSLDFHVESEGEDFLNTPTWSSSTVIKRAYFEPDKFAIGYLDRGRKYCHVEYAIVPAVKILLTAAGVYLGAYITSKIPWLAFGGGLISYGVVGSYRYLNNSWEWDGELPTLEMEYKERMCQGLRS